MMRQDYPLKLLCQTLECNRSTFYHERKQKDNAQLKRAIEGVVEQRPTYGYRRGTAELYRGGRRVNHKKVLRLMRQMGLTSRRPVRRRRTTDSEHPFPR